jgi:hypothetical protein
VGSHRVFRFFWWATNALLAFALLATLFTGIWEHSVRQYLSGFSGAIIPEGSSPEQKAQAKRVAHVRVGALPVLGPFLRRALDTALSGWDESLDWRLLLERRSFAFFFLLVWALTFFFLLRIVLAWIADHRLCIPRLHLGTSLSRATATFFSTPEMK